MSQTFSGFEWFSYIKITIDTVGIVTNIINILVFLSPKLKDPSYKFMLVKAITNLIYMALAFETEIVTYCRNCPWSGSYYVSFNTTQMFIFFASFLHLYTIVINVVISVFTYCILINKPWPGKYTYIWVSLGLLVASFLFYAQKMFIFTIIPIPNTDKFTYIYSDFGNTTFNRVLIIIQNFGRVVLAVVVVSIINIMNVIKFRKRFKLRIFGDNSKKSNNHHEHSMPTVSTNNRTDQGVNGPRKSVQTTKSTQSQSQNSASMTKNITLMVIASLFINIIGELPYGITFTTNFVGVSNAALTLSVQISNILLLVPPAVELFVYYLFNKLFRSVVDGALKKIAGFLHLV